VQKAGPDEVRAYELVREGSRSAWDQRVGVGPSVEIRLGGGASILSRNLILFESNSMFSAGDQHQVLVAEYAVRG
jgi:hypothetical protein